MSTSRECRARAMTFLVLALGAREARAHFDLRYPPERGVSLESAPCGAAGSRRGSTPTVLRPGQTIVLEWEVQVDHVEPPRFRIAFDDAGQDFPTPVGAHDTSTLPLFLDVVTTPGTGVRTKEIALPNIECDNCTLQMLQYLAPEPPYQAGSFYYHCADITLSAGAPTPVDADAASTAPDPDAGAPMPVDADAASAVSRPDADAPATVTGALGCQSAGGGGAELPVTVLFAALVARAARRSPA